MTKEECEDSYIRWFMENSTEEGFLNSLTKLYACGVSTRMDINKVTEHTSHVNTGEKKYTIIIKEC